MSQPIIICLHGIFQGYRHLKPISQRFQDQGYQVYPLTYRWRREPFDQYCDHLAATINHLLASQLSPQSSHLPTDHTAPYYIFAHSMGSLVTRYLITQSMIPHPAKVVLCGPPNQGSEVVDFLIKLRAERLIIGQNARLLSTDKNAGALELPPDLPDTIDVGIIAGNTAPSLSLGKHILPKPNDGRVALHATHLNGERDHITIPVSHWNLLKDPKTAKLSDQFFKNSTFDHNI